MRDRYIIYTCENLLLELLVGILKVVKNSGVCCRYEYNVQIYIVHTDKVLRVEPPPQSSPFTSSQWKGEDCNDKNIIRYTNVYIAVIAITKTYSVIMWIIIIMIVVFTGQHVCSK